MELRGTTILAVKDENGTAVAGDGQVTFGQAMVMKHGARKVRTIYKDKVTVGFAGSTADAFTLFERFEKKLESFSGNLIRAAVELAKDWRTDKYLRKLEAMLLAADAENILIITGNGDVIEPDDDVAAIGSGGSFALAAARGLVAHTDLDAETVVRESLKLAALAEPYQIRSAFHGAGDLGPVAQAASVTVGCVIPNFGVQEWTKYPEPAYDVIKGACEYRDGYAYPNDAPGLGLDLDEELAAKYPYKEAWMPLRRRRDGTMHVY